MHATSKAPSTCSSLVPVSVAATEYPADGHAFDPNGPNAWLLMAKMPGMTLDALARAAVALHDVQAGRLDESEMETYRAPAPAPVAAETVRAPR